MKDINKIAEKVRKRKLQLQPLFNKDRENCDLWTGKEQIFGTRTKDGETHPMDVNITGTEMTSHGRRMQASMLRSRLDIHVLPPNPLENPDAKDTASQEERMYHYIFRQADERLVAMGEAPLLPSVSWQIVVPGRTAVMTWIYEEGGEIIWNLEPINVSFLTFEFDRKGLAWACYETFRSPSSIKDEYKKDVIEESQGKGISVSDYWDRKDNVTYLTREKETLETRDNKSGEVPIIFQPVAGAPKVIDENGIDVTAWGQSTYDPVKAPFRKLNELRSIWATHTHMLAKRPIEEIYEDGTDPNIEEEHLEFHAGALIKHPKSIELKSMEIADIPNSLPAMVGDLQTGIQRLTGAELHPEWAGSSGAALRIAGQDRQDVLVSGVTTLNNLYTRICRTLKKQIIVQGLTISVKTVANGEYLVKDMTPELLDNDFYVAAEFVKQDVYDEVEAVQTAKMMIDSQLLSREDAMERILKEPDVPAQMMKIKIEQIEAAIPELSLPDIVKAYEEDLKLPDKAKMVRKHLAMMEIEKQQAIAPQQERPPPARRSAPGGQR